MEMYIDAQLAVFVLAATEWIKSNNLVEKKWVPVIAILVSMSLSVSYALLSGMNITQAVLRGAATGFSTTLGYAAIKSATSKK
jgi:hypothetical protein